MSGAGWTCDKCGVFVSVNGPGHSCAGTIAMAPPCPRCEALEGALKLIGGSMGYWRNPRLTSIRDHCRQLAAVHPESKMLLEGMAINADHAIESTKWIEEKVAEALLRPATEGESKCPAAYSGGPGCICHSERPAASAEGEEGLSYLYCPWCGPITDCDEDGCCQSCGADSAPMDKVLEDLGKFVKEHPAKPAPAPPSGEVERAAGELAELYDQMLSALERMGEEQARRAIPTPEHLRVRKPLYVPEDQSMAARLSRARDAYRKSKRGA